MVRGQLVSEFTLLVFWILLLASVQFLLMLLVLLLGKLFSYKQEVCTSIIIPHLGGGGAACLSKAFIPYFSKSRFVLCKLL